MAAAIAITQDYTITTHIGVETMLVHARHIVWTPCHHLAILSTEKAPHDIQCNCVHIVPRLQQGVHLRPAFVSSIVFEPCSRTPHSYRTSEKT